MEASQLEAIAEIIRLTETAIPSAFHRARFLSNLSSSLKTSSTGRKHLVAASPLSNEDMGSVERVLTDGGLGIYPDLIASSRFTGELSKRFGIKLKGRTVNAVLLAKGFESYGKLVFWRGTGERWYFRGDRPGHPGRLADTLEEARKFAE